MHEAPFAEPLRRPRGPGQASGPAGAGDSSVPPAMLLEEVPAFDGLAGGPTAGFPPAADLLGDLASSEETSPLPSSTLPELSPEEQQRRKRRRRWEAEQEDQRRWDLQRRLADLSADVEFLTREVGRHGWRGGVPVLP